MVHLAYFGTEEVSAPIPVEKSPVTAEITEAMQLNKPGQTIRDDEIIRSDNGVSDLQNSRKDFAREAPAQLQAYIDELTDVGKGYNQPDQTSSALLPGDLTNRPILMPNIARFLLR